MNKTDEELLKDLATILPIERKQKIRLTMNSKTFRQLMPFSENPTTGETQKKRKDFCDLLNVHLEIYDAKLKGHPVLSDNVIVLENVPDQSATLEMLREIHEEVLSGD